MVILFHGTSMKKTDCEVCKHGSRHPALDANGVPVPRDWVSSKESWTYFVCAKNTFSITDNCNKFQKV